MTIDNILYPDTPFPLQPSLVCERCQHEWEPRGPRAENRPRGASEGDLKPRICPHCKSAYWETAKRPVAKSTGGT